jgi:hypothetical protein
MDLQTRKLNAIKYLINIQDENILNKIEATIYASKAIESPKLKPLTKKRHFFNDKATCQVSKIRAD